MMNQQIWNQTHSWILIWNFQYTISDDVINIHYGIKCIANKNYTGEKKKIKMLSKMIFLYLCDEVLGILVDVGFYLQTVLFLSKLLKIKFYLKWFLISQNFPLVWKYMNWKGCDKIRSMIVNLRIHRIMIDCPRPN